MVRTDISEYLAAIQAAEEERKRKMDAQVILVLNPELECGPLVERLQGVGFEITGARIRQVDGGLVKDIFVNALSHAIVARTKDVGWPHRKKISEYGKDWQETRFTEAVEHPLQPLGIRPRPFVEKAIRLSRARNTPAL